MCRQKKPPSVSRFERGRGGDGGGVSTEKLPPSVSHLERGRGWRWWWRCVNRETTPPSHLSSEGGVEGVLKEETPPPSHVSSEGGDVSTRNPSVSQFERGRGWWWCVEEETPPPSHVSSEGGGWRGCIDLEPLRLAIRAREGLVMHRQKKHPLRLAFRAREGWRVCRQKKDPLCLVFRAREGWSGVGVLTEYPLRLVIRAREGTEGVQRHDEERCLFLRRVGSVVACSQ